MLAEYNEPASGNQSSLITTVIMNAMPNAIQILKNGLIVSCQARAGSPLDDPRIIAAFARVAEGQNAVGVRINGEEHIRAVRRAVGIPIIGIEKRRTDGFPVYITPSLGSARRVHLAGAAIIALDATARPRPNGESLDEIMSFLKREIKVLVVADVATADEGLYAAERGADAVATTLHGYTKETEGQGREGPAFDLLHQLVKRLSLPVILEGRVRDPDDVRKAFDLGAHAVVVGTAITNMEWRARTFVDAALKTRL